MKGEVTRAITDLAKRGGMSLEEMVAAAARTLSVERTVVAKSLYNLCIEGKIILEDSNPPRSLTRYVASVYSLSFWIAVCLVSLTLLAVYVFPQTAPFTYSRYVLGSIFVLYLPGATFINLFYPMKELTSLERLAFSL